MFMVKFSNDNLIKSVVIVGIRIVYKGCSFDYRKLMEKSIEFMKRVRQLRSLKWKMEFEEREYFDKKIFLRCKWDGI